MKYIVLETFKNEYGFFSVPASNLLDTREEAEEAARDFADAIDPCPNSDDERLFDSLIYNVGVDDDYVYEAAFIKNGEIVIGLSVAAIPDGDERIEDYILNSEELENEEISNDANEDVIYMKDMRAAERRKRTFVTAKRKKTRYFRKYERTYSSVDLPIGRYMKGSACQRCFNKFADENWRNNKSPKDMRREERLREAMSEADDYKSNNLISNTDISNNLFKETVFVVTEVTHGYNVSVKNTVCATKREAQKVMKESFAEVTGIKYSDINVRFENGARLSKYDYDNTYDISFSSDKAVFCGGSEDYLWVIEETAIASVELPEKIHEMEEKK